MNHSKAKGTNPLLKMDFPDVDVIFVDGTFYLVTTTMHFFPGVQILRSYDLIHWEHAAYVCESIDGTDAQRLENGKQIYGKGMWAASLRYHEGLFYVVFVCNDTHKTYLYTAPAVEGPWKKSTIEGFYHDCSLLFDEGKAYLVYGNRDVWLTELNDDLTGPREGGLHRMIVSDAGNPSLGYEGSHLYRIGDRYYVFFIHSRRDRWRRVEAMFSADSLEGEFTGGDVFDDDLGFMGSGIAQGGIVEGPEGVWNAVLFQDRGAAGRIPVLVPVTYTGETFVFGTDGKAAEEIETADLRPGYVYAPLYGSDDFRYDPKAKYAEDPQHFGCFGYRSFWQFNHEPDLSLVSCDAAKGELRIKTDRTVTNIFHAKNILTQRMLAPGCAGEVTLDGTGLRDGDFAGLVTFQGDYLQVGIRRKDGKYYAFAATYTNESGDVWALGEEPAVLREEIPLEGSSLRVRLEVSFADGKTRETDSATGYLRMGEELRRIGPEQGLRFRLDHFTGCRFGLFVMSSSEAGGAAGFSDFRYEA